MSPAEESLFQRCRDERDATYAAIDRVMTNACREGHAFTAALALARYVADALTGPSVSVPMTTSDRRNVRLALLRELRALP